MQGDPSMKIDTKFTWVIDSSFTAPLFLGDEQSDEIDGFFNVIMQRQTPVFIPAMWWFEMSSILSLAVRRKRLSIAEALNVIEICEDFTFFQIEPITFNRTLFDLARTHHLSAYDASYLDLALRYQAGLASLNKQLNAVARELSIETWE